MVIVDLFDGYQKIQFALSATVPTISVSAPWHTASGSQPDAKAIIFGSIQPEKYEFLVYKLLCIHLDAGDVDVIDSLRFRSFAENLIPKEISKRDKDKILREIDAPQLANPMDETLKELEALYEQANQCIL